MRFQEKFNFLIPANQRAQNYIKIVWTKKIININLIEEQSGAQKVTMKNLY